MRPLLHLHDIRQAGLGRDEPQHDSRAEIYGTVVATVTAVYPPDHPKNAMGQTLVDLQYGEHLAPWRMVPLSAGHAHGETDTAVPFSRRRQPYGAKPRNQMEGATRDVRPGTRVLVSFPYGDLRAPMVTSILKFNRQGEGGFPKERHGVDRWKDGKLLDMVEAHPLDSSMGEFPRAVDSYNGTRQEIDNRGNWHLQTTNDREPVFPGHNGIPASPKPEGSASMSTRGARVGNIGRTTGKHPKTGDTSRGTFRDESVDAEHGTWIARLRSKVGRFFVSTRGSDDARIYLEDKKRDYLSLRANGRAELHGELRVTLDGNLVYLGHDGAEYNIVLWPQLNDILTHQFITFNTHTHGGVTTGESDTLIPNSDQAFYWLQHGPECRSDVAFADKDGSSSPTYEEDPDDGTSSDDDTDQPPDTDVRGYRTEKVGQNNTNHGVVANRWVRKVVKQ